MRQLLYMHAPSPTHPGLNTARFHLVPELLTTNHGPSGLPPKEFGVPRVVPTLRQTASATLWFALNQGWSLRRERAGVVGCRRTWTAAIWGEFVALVIPAKALPQQQAHATARGPSTLFPTHGSRGLAVGLAAMLLSTTAACAVGREAEGERNPAGHRQRTKQHACPLLCEEYIATLSTRFSGGHARHPEALGGAGRGVVRGAAARARPPRTLEEISVPLLTFLRFSISSTLIVDPDRGASRAATRRRTNSRDGRQRAIRRCAHASAAMSACFWPCELSVGCRRPWHGVKFRQGGRVRLRAVESCNSRVQHPVLCARPTARHAVRMFPPPPNFAVRQPGRRRGAGATVHSRLVTRLHSPSSLSWEAGCTQVQWLHRLCIRAMQGQPAKCVTAGCMGALGCSGQAPGKASSSRGHCVTSDKEGVGCAALQWRLWTRAPEGRFTRVAALALALATKQLLAR